MQPQNSQRTLGRTKTRGAWVTVPLLGALCISLAACSSISASSTTGAPNARVITPAPTTVGTNNNGATSPQTAAPKPADLKPPAGMGFTATASSPAIYTTTRDNGSIALMWMDPHRLKFRFIPGYKWPENSPTIAADHNASTWTSTMVAAFNGGFKLSDHVGGYYYHGHTVAKLRSGLAALAVHSDGTLNVGVWGAGLRMTSDIVAVRENLPPIVRSGHSQAKPSDSVGTWGLALHDLWNVNRSALGQRPDGTLIFEFGNHVTPKTIARYLVQAGVRDAVMLDMNETWPTGFLYRHTSSGEHGKRISSGIVKSPSIYYQRNDKDFIVVAPR